MSKSAWKYSVAALLVMNISACTARIANHGYLPPEDQLEQLVVGVDTRGSVEDVLGTPNSSGVMNDGGWYYISTQIRSYASFEPKVVSREMVAVSFDGDDVVSNIERFSLEDGRIITLSRRVTEPPVKGPSFLRQLLGNLTNFDPAAGIGGG